MTTPKRNFPNFLESYRSYAEDNFCPPEFHKWVGISIIAAALERKVSLKQGKLNHYPNIYVMLVSHPGSGKSTAMEVGTDLIETYKKDKKQDFRIIPNQATEPALVDMMKITDRIQIPGTSLLVPQSAGYLYASEASSSALQNTCGDFVAALTAFYDCPKWFRKKLKGDPYPTEIENSCMNLLAGSTFDYLKTLVNETSVMGGFASRILYIVSTDRKVRENVRWHDGKEIDRSVKERLLDDLEQIGNLIGPMHATPEWIKRYESWRPKFERFLIDLNSPKLESINARRGTHLIKLSMILAVADGNELIMTEKHFDGALELMEEATKENTQILRSAIMSDRESQAAVTQAILVYLERNNGEMKYHVLKENLLSFGSNLVLVSNTLDYMLSSKTLCFRGPGSEVIAITDKTKRHF